MTERVARVFDDEDDAAPHIVASVSLGAVE
jgi:hypothetical protein